MKNAYTKLHGSDGLMALSRKYFELFRHFLSSHNLARKLDMLLEEASKLEWNITMLRDIKRIHKKILVKTRHNLSKT